MPKPNVKEQIVAASLDLLHSKGFNATSVQDITSAAGVPKGSFYNHFTSKEALGLEVVDRYTEHASAALALLQEAGVPARERVRNYYARMIAWGGEQNFQRGCMLGNFSTELSQQIPAMRERLQLAYAATRAHLERTIAEGQHAGEINDALSAGELAGFINDAWQGAVLRSKTEQDVTPLERFINVLIHRILV